MNLEERKRISERTEKKLEEEAKRSLFSEYLFDAISDAFLLSYIPVQASTR
jgi:hypothetical protein